MKNVYLTVPVLLAGLLAGCGGSGGGSGTTKPIASITITASNADSVAKGAMSAKSTSDTGTSTANNAKTAGLVADPAQKYSALSLALANIKKAESLPFPAANGSKAVSGFPVSIDCTTLTQTTNSSNIVTYDIVDPDNSGDLSVGDTFKVTYTSCAASSTVTINGVSYIEFNSLHAPATPSTSDPESASVTLGYTSLTIASTSPIETFSLDGSMTMSYTWDGAKLSASMTGTSFTASDTATGSVTFSNFNFTSTLDSSTWTSSVDLTISMTPAGSSTAGTVNISTPTTFSGPNNGNPTAGQMRIDGANGSYLTITARNDGSGADIVVFDGTNTTNLFRTWAQL